ncbi:MAG: DUF3466 family protein [Candidatus Omnitrophica bacterium]|nr:DUF3466 family protein [Candidatus Omnitrophota bacterium]
MNRHGKIQYLLIVAIVMGMFFAGYAGAEQQVPAAQPENLRSEAAESSPAGEYRADSEFAGAPVLCGNQIKLVAPERYRLRILEPLPGYAQSKVFGVNNRGQAVGRSYNYNSATAKEEQRQATLWDENGTPHALSNLFGESSAWSINDNGQVSGYAFLASGYRHAVRWNLTTGTVQDLGTLQNTNTGVRGNESTSYSINNLGYVVGNADIPNDANDFTPFHAFLFTDMAGMLDLKTFDTLYSYYQFGYSIAYDINNFGQIVGIAHDSNWNFRPFIYDVVNGMRQLPTPSGFPLTEWYAVCINDQEMIAGHLLNGGLNRVLFYWDSPFVQPAIITMPESHANGEFYAMNNAGTCVGLMWDDTDTDWRGFVFDKVAGVRDLNSITETLADWKLEVARDINDNDQIAGYGKLAGQTKGYILTPAVDNRCDINQDGIVNILDITISVNVLLGVETNAALVTRSDVNLDQSVNILDVTLIVNQVMGIG